MKSIVIISILFQFVFFYNTAICQSEKSSSHYIDAKTPEGLKQIFRYTGKSTSFLSSHRGGPEKNLPENCIATFENTLKYTCSLMEIDPRYSKDSVIVLFHDPVLQRTSTGEGKVADFTYEELKQLKLKDAEGNTTLYQIPTLEEALNWTKGKTILVLDKKDVPISERVKMIEKCHAESCAIVMAYNYEEARQCYQMNKNIMMQVFIKEPSQIAEFEKTGIPWENVVVFIAHQLPDDLSVFDKLHQRGVLCILGTSRNLDRELTEGEYSSSEMKKKYDALYQKGADILETDIPVEVSKLMHERLASKMLNTKHAQH
ncbi:MAG: glycerophosphodiester phosphodiesterase family protein [Prolixibacteraceae bacterium]